MNSLSTSGYKYQDSTLSHAHQFLLPALVKKINLLELNTSSSPPLTIFDLGCGNGSVAKFMTDEGWVVMGGDPSCERIHQAVLLYPELNLHEESAYDKLAEKFGRFGVVISLEVVERIYAPRDYARTLFDFVKLGGTVILSTPYHGYLKNVALAVTGKISVHFTALWDHGHIKFWSISTLTNLQEEAGFVDSRFERVDRIPSLARSMIAGAHKP